MVNKKIISIILITILSLSIVGFYGLESTKPVYAQPEITINPTGLIKLGVGQHQIFNVTVNYGQGPFSYVWTSNGTEIQRTIDGPNNDILDFVFIEQCNFVTLNATVTDSLGNSAFVTKVVYDPFVARDIYLQEIPTIADFIIYGGSGYFWSVYNDGSIYQNSTSKLNVTQGALDYLNTTFGEGTVWLNDMDIPSGLTYRSGVLLLEMDEGVINFHGDFGHTPYQSQDMPVMIFHNHLNTSKAYIEWRNADNEKIAWITAHDYLNDTQHKHFSIETVQADMSTAVTRFQITYGVDTAKVQIVNANFEVSNTGLIFMQDTNTKIWRNAEDDLRISVGGSTRIQVQNSTTTVTNDLSVSGEIYYNSEAPHINRLSGVTPIASSWDTDPTNLSASTDGDWDVGTGIGADLNVGSFGAGGSLVWDMGGNYSVNVHALITIGNNISQNVRTRIYTSFDNSNWYECVETASIYLSISATNETWTISTTAHTRYIKLAWDNGSSGADVFGAVSEIEAIDINW